METKLKTCSVCLKETRLWISKPPTCKSCSSKKPKKQTAEQKEFKKELNVFFASQTLQFPFLCDNCFKPLEAFNTFEKRCCIAHILAKKQFPTVATHPQNKLFLCAKGGCHAKFDNATAKERSEMNVYMLALERYEQLKEHLTEAEIVKANKYLGINE